MKSKARNSHSKRNNNTDENKKALNKNNNEKTGCFDRTTAIALPINKTEQLKNNT